MKVIEIESLARAFTKHVITCRSANVLCTVHVAFESWFRLELAHTLHTETEGNISFDCPYEGSSYKGDLMLEINGRKAAFELKSFVQGSDANKLASLPRQLDLIRTAVANNRVAQGVAFCTFIGYTSERMKNLCARFFSQPWESTDLLPILEDKPLRFMLASVDA